MRIQQLQQENLARRFDPDLFDCTLPEDAIDELLRPRRPRILLPPAPPKKPSWLDSVRSWAKPARPGLCALVVLMALSSTLGWLAHKPTTLVPAPPILQARPTATPVPAIGQPLPPLRAPRAQLVRLPSPELGVYHWYELPEAWGGGRVFARYMGVKDSFSQIPANAKPGDMWAIREAPLHTWVLCTPPGYTHAMWIDP